MSKLRYLRLKYLIRLPYFLFKKVFVQLPFMHFIRNTRYTQTPISFITWWRQKVLGYNRDPYWPIHFTSTFGGDWRNVYCGIETCPGFSPGNYIQAQGKIYIGDYTQIAPNVGIISANHQLEDNRLHDVKDVVIGKYCWIGMGHNPAGRNIGRLYHCSGQCYGDQVLPGRVLCDRWCTCQSDQDPG